MTGARPAAWRTEARTGGLIAVYAGLLGAAVGLVWATLAPEPPVRRAFFVQPAAAHQLVGLDVWFAGIAAVAGLLVAVAALRLLGDAARTVGAIIGVAVGGVLGSLVADRVGYLANGTSAVEALGKVAAVRHYSARQLGQVASLLDFRVHMPGVLLIWSLVGVVVLGAAALFGDAEPAPSD